MFNSEDLLRSWCEEVGKATSLQALEDLRIRVLGKNGELTHHLRNLSNLSLEEKKQQGQALNALKEKILNVFQQRREELLAVEKRESLERQWVDVTLPTYEWTGKIHPLTQVQESIAHYFLRQGFQLVEGPEVEDEFHNFDALNIPKLHPARQSHDTFYLRDFPRLLRTHTSTVEIRCLKNNPPPLRIISMGRVYRNDALDMTHTPMFHQLEGLVIEPNIHIGHLKGCIEDFCRCFFERDDLPVRFRPSFFPFTEPSAEVDIGCSWNGGRLEIGNKGEWLELLGCGMTHPNVLRQCGVDPKQYQGFAFGMGIERLLMLKYGIPDIRSLYESDYQWLQNYGSHGLLF